MTGDFVLATSLYYVVTLLAGITLFVLGYQLFARGVTEPRPVAPEPPGAPAPSGIHAKYGTAQLKLENVAPGTVFVVMGSILVGIGLLRGPQAISAASDQAVKHAQAELGRKELEVAMAPRPGSPYGFLTEAPKPSQTPLPGGSSGIGRTDRDSLEGLQKEAQKQLDQINTLIEARKRHETLVRKWSAGEPLAPEEKAALQNWLLGLPFGSRGSAAAPN